MNPSEHIEPKTSKKRPYRWLRRLIRVFAAIFLLLFLIVLFVRSPWGQGIIVDTAVNYVSGKTNTKVAIEKLFITFSGNVQLEGLFLEDKKGDTLIYSKSLEVDIPLWKTITGKALGIDNLNWDGLTVNIIRKDTLAGYNFQFLMDALVSADTTSIENNSESKPLNLIIGDLNLTHVDLRFDDDVIGINSHFKIGAMKVEMETTDIENMIYEASDIALTDANIRFIQKSVAIDTASSETPLPKFKLENLSLNSVIAYYKSEPDALTAKMNLAALTAENPQIDMAEKIFNFKTLKLNNSDVSININTSSQAEISIANSDMADESQAFEWPAIQLQLSELMLSNNNFTYTVNNTFPEIDIFNPDAIALNNLTLNANEIYINNQTAGLKIDRFHFNEISGLNLNQLEIDFSITDQRMVISDLDFQFNNNSVTGYLELHYNELQKLFDNPEKVNINANLPSFSVSLKDVFKFQPELSSNAYLNTLSQKQLSGSINASGILASVSIPNAKVNWGGSTQISATGTLENITDSKTLQFNIPKFNVNTQRSDLVEFVNEEELGISLPENVKLSGVLNGSLDNIVAKATLNTSHGEATLDGNFKNQNTITYDAVVTVKDYQIDQLLNNPQLGDLSLTISSSGSGTTINTLDAKLDATISKFNLNNYAIEDLKINGSVKDGTGRFFSTYKDSNLNLNLDGFVVLDSIAPEVKAELNIIGANLQALGLMERNVKTGMNLFLDFKGNSETFNVSANVEDGVFVYDNRTYILGSLEALAYVSKDTTSVFLKNRILDVNLKSNTDPQTFSKSIKRHILSYFYRDEALSDTIINPVSLKLEGKISQSPLLNDVFLVNVKDLDTIDISIDFNEKARQLKANITAPHINYSGNVLDSLVLSINTDQERFNFNFGFKNIVAGPLDIPETKITGNQSNNELSLDFYSSTDDITLMHINTKITGNSERLRLSINPDSLILNRNNWAIPTNNEVILTDNNIEFNNFEITRNGQSILATDKLPEISKSHAALSFKNFRISEVLNYLNPETTLGTGQLSGNFILEEPFGQTGIVANLGIKQLEILKTDLGTLTVEANSLGGNSYDFNANLKDGLVDLDFTGDYVATNESANLNLNLDINDFKMEALNSLSQGEIKKAKGSFSGQFKVTGTPQAPLYNGQLNFNNANFNIAKLNTSFTFLDETLQLDNRGISMSNFTIRDINDNMLVLSGAIGTENFLNPTFDLSLKANNFQVLNAKKENNENFYGKATFDADAKLTGDLQIPKLNASITVGSDTNFVYVLPASVASIEERDGVVTFVNRENPDAILTQTEAQTATIKGFDIASLIKVGKEATVTIVLDEETGDNFKVSGEGDFNLSMSPNGRINLSGVYEIAAGHYELNLYGLVNRKFFLAPGSRVSWSGDPFDAKLDVRAIYNLETSASSLMAPQISGADPSVQSRYRQVLPFNVYLNIDGELLQPKISFQLDMPEEQQGSIGGQVYGRVQQVNQQEGELNRQVFSLLVLNRFYPDPGSDGSSGGFATIARDNLNDAVSEQLNAFSDKILGDTGVELDFGLDSFTDYQGDAPTDRTQLDIAAQKKLFNDRLTVRVGSEVDIEGSSQTGEATPLIGNVSLEYTLTEDGRYRLKGFRKSEFENIIDGQTIVSGIALIFTQEFNQFSELWDAIFRSVKEKNVERKAAEEKLKATEEAADKSIEKKKN